MVNKRRRDALTKPLNSVFRAFWRAPRVQSDYLPGNLRKQALMSAALPQGFSPAFFNRAALQPVFCRQVCVICSCQADNYHLFHPPLKTHINIRINYSI